MIDPNNIVKSLALDSLTAKEQLEVLAGIEKTIKNSRVQRAEMVKSNVDVVINLLKKIEADIKSRYDAVGNKIEQRVASIKDGRDGRDGKDGKDGKIGPQGPKGDRGIDGKDGKDGVAGQDGVSVTDAKIDFDGSLVITLSNGREINVGEVVSTELAEKIKVTMSTNTALTIQDEGTTLTSGARTINFTGSGVTATTSGDDVTVNITGGGGGGSGTVTSVSWTGGIVSVATPTTTPAFTIAGTSGGIPYFSSSSTWASSGALTANALMIGGGAGNAPATTTTGTGVLTALGNSVNATSGLTTTDGTATLSNKRINPRVVTGGTSGNLTINGDTTDVYKAESLTGAVTFLQPSGTPVDGQRLMIRLEDNGSARGITWTTSSGAFRAVGITLPTTTTAGKVTYVGCVYNSSDTFWDAVATVTQA